MRRLKELQKKADERVKRKLANGLEIARQIQSDLEREFD